MTVEIGSDFNDKSISKIIENLHKHPLYKIKSIELNASNAYEDSYGPLVVRIQHWHKTSTNSYGQITQSITQLGEGTCWSHLQDSHGNTVFHYISEMQDEQRRKEIARLFIEAGLAIDVKNNQQQLPAKYEEFKALQYGLVHNAKLKWARLLKNENLRKELDRLTIGGIAAILSILCVFALGLISSIIAICISSLVILVGLVGSYYLCTVSEQHIEKIKTISNFVNKLKSQQLSKELILEYKAKGVDLQKALTTAANLGHVPTIELLLQNGATLEKETFTYTFCKAVRENDLQTATYLRNKYQVDVSNSKDFVFCHGESPLLMPIMGNQPAMVEFLLKNGAQIHGNDFLQNWLKVKNHPRTDPSKPYTLVDLAIFKGDPTVIKLLRDHQAGLKADDPSNPLIFTPQDKTANRPSTEQTHTKNTVKVTSKLGMTL